MIPLPHFNLSAASCMSKEMTGERAWYGIKEYDMREFIAYSTIAGSTLLIALSGCASFRGCGAADCQGDREITSDVEHLIDGTPALMGSVPITVQTNRGVVYLNGMVETDLERYMAENLAKQVPNVAMVVNDVSVQEK
jgi:osmotically-inducible protein OsmY